MKNILFKFLTSFLVVVVIMSALPVSSARAADTGFQSPTGCTTNAVTQWTTPGNATASDNNFTTSNANNEVLICSYNLPAIPAGNSVTNIEVEIEGFASGTRESAVDLSWNAGTTFTGGDPNTTFTNNSTETTFTLNPGAGTNTPWGRTWAVGDFTAANFRVRFISNNGTNIISVDQIRVRVTYEPPVTITVTQGANGNITPVGPLVSVPYLGDQPFSITPNTSFIVDDVIVDGSSVGRLNAYTFNNVITSTHTITASFNGGWFQPSSNINSGWTNSTNAYVSDDAYIVANAGSDVVNYCGFNLGITGSTIDGIEVAIEGYATAGREIDVSLSWDGGTSHTATQTTSMPNGGSEATYILGSNSNDWGRTWTDTELSNANFCVQLDATLLALGNVNVDQVQVRLTYHPAVFYTITASAGAGGTITPSGAISAQDTSDHFFDSTPNTSFILADVLVDGGSVGRANAYTFNNVLADHTIASSFNGGWTAPSSNVINAGLWLNPGNLYTSNNTYASSPFLNGVVTLAGINIVPAIPAAATIEGIEIAIEGYETGSKEINVSLSWDGGTTYTAVQATSFVNDGPERTLVLGGPTNTWGRTWTGAEFANFRIRLASPFSIGTIFVDQVQVKVYHDDVPPDTTITVNPTNPSNDSTPDFEFTGTDDVGGSGIASFECQIDGGGFSACTSPATFGPLTDGSHTFDVRAIDNAGNVDPTPATYTWIIDLAGPSVSTVNSFNDTGDGILAEYEIASVNTTMLFVTFSEDVYDPVGNSDTDDVTNANNYILVRDYGNTAGFQTLACSTGADEPEDTRITVDSVTYDNTTFTATLTINGGLPLSNGAYRLFVCGTTSITDLAGLPLNFNGNAGEDFTRNFLINIPSGGNNSGSGNSQSALGSLLPITGFAPSEIITLPAQPLSQMYNQTGFKLEIPSLSININIVGVNRVGASWDVKWLGNNAGYLEGSAYPTWSGNTVLTGHVTDAANIPGPFAYLKELKDGDKVYIHSDGLVYVYEVQQSFTVTPSNVSEVFKHQDYDWLTLVTCENYNDKFETYTSRRVVRAILISVYEEK